MTPYETIRLSASMLTNNETIRGVCPWCVGGTTREESFIITRVNGMAKFICHRASCRPISKGAISISGDPVSINSTDIVPRKPKRFDTPTKPLSEQNLHMLYGKYELCKEACASYRLRETETSQKIVIPLFSFNGVSQGIELKRGYTGAGGKTYVFHNDKSDKLAWYIGKSHYTLPPGTLDEAHMRKEFYDESLLIVEDVVSAMKANAFINTVAILGTWINAETAAYIATKKFKHVILALDKDAAAVSVKTAERLKGILPMRVMLLERDIKDMRYKDIATLLSMHTG